MGVDPTVSRREIGSATQLSSGTGNYMLTNPPIPYDLYAGIPISCLKCESAFNQEKALVGAFSLIGKTDGSFAALRRTQHKRAVVVTNYCALKIVQCQDPACTDITTAAGEGIIVLWREGVPRHPPPASTRRLPVSLNYL